MMRTFAAVALIACALGCAAHGDNAYSGTVQTELAQIGSTVGGRVTAVNAGDGDAVRSGQIIVRFDDADQRAALAAARALAREAQARLDVAVAGARPEDIARAQAQAEQASAALAAAQSAAPHQVAQAQSNVQQRSAAAAQAQAAARQAQRDYERLSRLYAQGAVSAQAHDAARSQRDQTAAAAIAARDAEQAARQQYQALAHGSVPGDVAQAQANYAAAAAALSSLRNGARPEDIAALRAARDAASANVGVAAARLDQTVVRSPANGTVESIDLRVGDLVQPGAVVASIDEHVDPFVRIYVAQKDLGHFHVGAEVPVRAESLGGQTFQGRVVAVDSRAQFTPRDVQTADDRANLVFGVKVRIADPQRRLFDGTTVTLAP